MKFIVVIRDVPHLKPDYSLAFEAPDLPRVGDYLSIHRPDKPHGHTEDLIVRHIWWRLSHPETGAFAQKPQTGSVVDIQVECDPAIGPHSTDSWLESYAQYLGQGQVEQFNLARFSVRERDFPHG